MKRPTNWIFVLLALAVAIGALVVLPRLGVPYTTVIDDAQEGMDGALPALIGDVSNGTWYVAAFEVEGERLEMHRARLAVGATAAVGKEGR